MMAAAALNTSADLAALRAKHTSSASKMELDEVLAPIGDECRKSAFGNNDTAKCYEALCALCGHELSSKCLLQACTRKEASSSLPPSPVVCEEVVCARCKRELSIKCLMKMCQPVLL